MKPEHLQVFRDVMTSTNFVAALKSFVETEIGYRIDALRSYARQGNVQQAGVVEGEIGLLCELTPLFEKYARRFGD